MFTPPSSLLGRLSLDDGNSRIDTAAALINEVGDLCEAVGNVEVQHPSRVRSDLIARFREIQPLLYDIQDEFIDDDRQLSSAAADLLLDYRRLQRRMDRALDDLDRIIDERQSTSRRSYSNELNDRFERGERSDRTGQFSQVRKSYDGWRRRP